MTPQEEVVDSFLRGLAAGDGEAMLSALPPGCVQEILNDLTTLSEEELARILQRTLQARFPCIGIREAHYRTEERGEDSAVVFCWGSLEVAGEGAPSAREITEEEALSFPLLRQGGRWYMDIGYR